MTKKTILDYCEGWLRKTRLSDLSICMILRISHFLLPYTCLFILLFGNKTLFILTTIFCLIVCILFYVFDGCIYTMLEFKFAKDDWTSLDPALEICGYEVTNENRKIISVYNFAINAVFIVWLYYFRFICRGKIIPTGSLNQT